MAYVTTIDISSSPGSAYTWETASFTWNAPDGGKTWDDLRPMVYTLRVGEGWGMGEVWQQQYQLKSQEDWQMAEVWSQAFACLISEAWQVSEQWSDVWLALMKITEGWTVAEALEKVILIPKAESWVITDILDQSVLKRCLEAWTIVETLSNIAVKLEQEGWGTGEFTSRLATKHSQETWQIADNPPVWNMLQAITEAWNTVETDQETVDFRYKALESVLLSESLANGITKPLAEAFTTTDDWWMETVKNLWEAWQTKDSAAHQSSFERVLAESFAVADAISKDQMTVFCEAVQTVEAYLRSANAVVSDLAFGTGDLSLEDFLKLNSPVGYSHFTAFVPGELEYQKALIALILKGPLTTGRPRVTDWQLTVDVPDQTDSGTCSIPAANTFIPFQRRFYGPPQVLVQLRGGSGGTPDITLITDTGFYVQISDMTGGLLAGDIIWSADGY